MFSHYSNMQVGPNGEKGYYDKNGNFISAESLNNQANYYNQLLGTDNEDQAVVNEISKNLMTASAPNQPTQNMPPQGGPQGGGGGGFNMLGLGAAGISALGSTMKGSYDQRIGMERPSMIGSMSDLQFTQMGSALGGPGAAVGFGVDMIKNAINYNKHKDQFAKAKSKADFYDKKQSIQQGMEADYTGLARHGLEVNKNPYTKQYMDGGMVPDYNYGGNAYMSGGMAQYGNGGDPGDPPYEINSALKKLYRSGYKSDRDFLDAKFAMKHGKPYQMNPEILYNPANALTGYYDPNTGAHSVGILGYLQGATTDGTEPDYYKVTEDFKKRAADMNSNKGYNIDAGPFVPKNVMPSREPTYSDQFNNRAANAMPSYSIEATGLYPRTNPLGFKQTIPELEGERYINIIDGKEVPHKDKRYIRRMPLSGNTKIINRK